MTGREPAGRGVVDTNGGASVPGRSLHPAGSAVTPGFVPVRWRGVVEPPRPGGSGRLHRASCRPAHRWSSCRTRRAAGDRTSTVCRPESAHQGRPFRPLSRMADHDVNALNMPARTSGGSRSDLDPTPALEPRTRARRMDGRPLGTSPQVARAEGLAARSCRGFGPSEVTTVQGSPTARWCGDRGAFRPAGPLAAATPAPVLCPAQDMGEGMGDGVNELVGL